MRACWLDEIRLSFCKILLRVLLLLLALLCAQSFFTFYFYVENHLNSVGTHLKSRKTVMSAWKLANLLASLMTRHSREHRANH